LPPSKKSIQMKIANAQSTKAPIIVELIFFAMLPTIV
jgi:hypothetical protein